MSLHWYTCTLCETEFLPGTGSDPDLKRCGLCYGKWGPAGQIAHLRLVREKSSVSIKPDPADTAMQASAKGPSRVLTSAGVDPKICETDHEHWRELSDKLGIPYRMPRRAEPCTVAKMTMWLQRLGRTVTWHRRTYNTKLAEFISLNPTWPLRAWVGLMFEQTNEEGAIFRRGPKIASEEVPTEEARAAA